MNAHTKFLQGMNAAVTGPDVKYTDPALVTGLKTDVVLTWRMVRTEKFYGPKIPTRNMIQYAGRWRRVYVVNYGNAGSAYVVVNGEDRYLDIHTEYALAEGLRSEYLLHL